MSATTTTDDASRRLRPLLGKAAGTLMVHEIYRSLQGESVYAGLPCVFIRLSACHLRCTYCDTPHAFGRGETFPIEEVIRQALALGDEVVEVTGGEPLLQPEVLPLMARLADLGKVVLLETSGACEIAVVDRRVHIIMDVKTPGSGEEAANLERNLPDLKPTDEIKYVVCDRADFDWSLAHARSRGLIGRNPLLVSPVHGRVDPADLAAWLLESREPIRLQVPLHKRLWGPDARGV